MEKFYEDTKIDIEKEISWVYVVGINNRRSVDFDISGDSNANLQ